MKHVIYLFSMLFLLTGLNKATSVNGRIVVENINDSTYIVKLQINTDTGLNDIGGATFVVSFDTSGLSFPSEPAGGVDYIFHNFTDGNYSLATVTKPRSKKHRNMIWLNIELDIDDNGSLVAGNNEWTDLVTLNFKRLSAKSTDLISWEVNNKFWAIYDENNSAFWSTGNFNNTPVSTGGGQSALDAFELSQNYPNPFNPSTTIGFNLKEDGNVKLTVYNTLGEEIEILVNSQLTQGYHTVTFSRFYLPTGIYFYKLDVENKFSEIKKMILLK